VIPCGRVLQDRILPRGRDNPTSEPPVTFCAARSGRPGSSSGLLLPPAAVSSSVFVDDLARLGHLDHAGLAEGTAQEVLDQALYAFLVNSQSASGNALGRPPPTAGRTAGPVDRRVSAGAAGDDKRCRPPRAHSPWSTSLGRETTAQAAVRQASSSSPSVNKRLEAALLSKHLFSRGSRGSRFLFGLSGSFLGARLREERMDLAVQGFHLFSQGLVAGLLAEEHEEFADGTVD
jgi:hypothetical protein